MSLKPNATVFDIVSSLNNAQQWFIDLLKVFSSIVRDADSDARVRIGVTGNGSSPNYMITFKDRSGMVIHRCRDGFSDEVDRQIHADGSTWSVSSSSLDEVQTAFHTLPPSAFKKSY